MSKKPNPYAWMTAMVIEQMRREEEGSKNPYLTLVTEHQRKLSMNAPTAPLAAPPVVPLHEHGAFADMGTSVDMLALGADALKGIGAMMQPETTTGDEQLNQTRRSDISAIFMFFGEALRVQATLASDSAQRLEMAASEMHP